MIGVRGAEVPVAGDTAELVRRRLRGARALGVRFLEEIVVGARGCRSRRATLAGDLLDARAIDVARERDVGERSPLGRLPESKLPLEEATPATPAVGIAGRVDPRVVSRPVERPIAQGHAPDVEIDIRTPVEHHDGAIGGAGDRRLPVALQVEGQRGLVVGLPDPLAAFPSHVTAGGDGADARLHLVEPEGRLHLAIRRASLLLPVARSRAGSGGARRSGRCRRRACRTSRARCRRGSAGRCRTIGAISAHIRALNGRDDPRPQEGEDQDPRQERTANGERTPDDPVPGPAQEAEPQTDAKCYSKEERDQKCGAHGATSFRCILSDSMCRTFQGTNQA